MGIDAADAENGDVEVGGQFFDERETLCGTIGMGGGGEEGAGDEVVGALELGFEGSLGIVDGAAYEHFVADEGAGFAGCEGMFAKVNAVGFGEEGDIDTFVDDKQDAAGCGSSYVRSQVEKQATGEVLFAELDHVDTATHGKGDLVDQRIVVTNSPVRDEAEGRTGEGWPEHPTKRFGRVEERPEWGCSRRRRACGRCDRRRRRFFQHPHPVGRRLP